MSRVSPGVTILRQNKEFAALAQLYHDVKESLKASRQENYDLHRMIQQHIIQREIEASKTIPTIKVKE